ncbi:MAG: DUF1501 domain-containing protein [Prosthecobacter sp.]|nr:DUF1501 domain-containing protein [Prosthecobacter sp.]
MNKSAPSPFPCGQVSRRRFLADMGLGFTGLALGSTLMSDGIARASLASAATPLVPRAKSVIWIFLSGGYSHVETFDPKPALTKYAGMTFDKTPFENPLNSANHRKRFRSVAAEEINKRDVYPSIYPMQASFRKQGQCGVEITDWWPHLSRCVDDIAFVRNMWTTDNDHFAENQLHTGRHRLDEQQPCIGSWVHYGLGTLNENLPKFVVLGGPTDSTKRLSIDSLYLGPDHAAVPLRLDPTNPLPFGKRDARQSAEAQRREYALIDKLNHLTAVEYPDDTSLRARIHAYELAYRMQMAVPETLDIKNESATTRQLYGMDQPATKAAGERLLAARRLVERGVRFVQVYPSDTGKWDSHTDLRKNHAGLCESVDKPVAGLLHDLKQRGLLDETLVVFCTEFGRTPGMETRSGHKDGRDHHPHGFTIWFAGGGTKGGTVHGETDELGYHALGEGHYITDLHATTCHLLGLDLRALEVPGRKRLQIDHGQVIREVLA